MKTKYTKKQIQESIKHWKKVLECMNEVECNINKQLYGSIYDINGHNKIIRETLNEDVIDDKKVVIDIKEEEMPEGDPSWQLGQQYHLRIEFYEAPLKRAYGVWYHPTPAGYWHVEGKRSDIIRLIRDEFTYGMDRSEREEFARESLSDKDFKKLFPSDDSLEKAFKEEEKTNSVNERDEECDEFGFLPDETDIWLFDFFDGTGRCRNGNYDKYAFASTSATTEQDVKQVLKRMTDSWSKRSLRDAKKEAKKRGEILRSWELPWYSFRADNIEHLSKDEYIKRNFKAVRFFDFNMKNEGNNKMKYTKKQITEAIKHWKKVLEHMNEANGDSTEHAVVETLKQILLDFVEKNHLDVSVLENSNYLPPFKKNQHPNVISIVHAGKGNNSTASDIYIQYYGQDKQIKSIGIEVKDSFSSNVFNPGITTNKIQIADPYGSSDRGSGWIENYGRVKLSYKNSQFDNFPSYRKSELNGFFNDLLAQHGKELEKQVQIALAGINHLLHNNEIQNEVINQLPFTPSQDTIDFGDYTYSYSDGRLGQLLQNYLVDPKSKYTGIPGTPVGNAMKKHGMTFNKNSISLCSYDVSGNDLIRKYFNELRKYKKSLYYPVQYLQFNDTLYSLGLDDSNFFTGNGSYKLANIDDDFDGLHISWRLAFPDGKTHKQYRILASVRLLTKNKNSATLGNTDQAPQINISDIYQG